MGMSEKERQVVVDLVSSTIAEAVAGYETEIAALRSEVAELKKASSARGLGAQDFTRLGDAIVTGMRDYVGRNLLPLVTRIRVLEDRPQLEYLGVWQDGRAYSRGCFVTHGGSVWFCREATTSKPPGPEWQLAVKGR